MGDRLADFSSGNIIKVHSNQLPEFVEIAKKNISKRKYRLCLHESPLDDINESFICVGRGEYERPHKHVNGSETHIIVQGKKALVFFDDCGEIIDIVIMNAASDHIACRINPNTYHTEIILSEMVIYFEIKKGPFLKDKSNIYPSWGPKPEDKYGVEEFLGNINREIVLRENEIV